jgi:hypothetical protein
MWGFAFLPFIVAAWRVREDTAVERPATPISLTAPAPGGRTASPRRALGALATGPR